MAFSKVNEHNKYVVGTAAAEQMHGAITREEGYRGSGPLEMGPPLTVNVTRSDSGTGFHSQSNHHFLRRRGRLVYLKKSTKDNLDIRTLAYRKHIQMQHAE